MIARFVFPLFLGVGGIVILLSLGFWQLDRLELKEAIIKHIQDRKTKPPVPLDTLYTQASMLAQNYRRVTLEGDLGSEEVHIYSPQKTGVHYRIIAPLDWNNRVVLVDLGQIKEDEKNSNRPTGRMRITGYISFPDDHSDIFTPLPDMDNNIWFSRLIAPIARHLGTEELLVVTENAEILSNDSWQPYTGVKSMPIASKIKNDHLEYAITWFALAFIWLMMMIYLIILLMKEQRETVS